MQNIIEARQIHMQIFRSKIDWWVLGFFISLTGLLLQLLLTMQAKGTLEQYPVHAAVYVLTAALVWWPIFSTRYKIDADTLLVQSMLFKWRIPLQQIQKVAATDHSIASPALSLDRLKIEYEQNGQAKAVLISPKNKSKFCQALQEGNAGIACKIERKK